MVKPALKDDQGLGFQAGAMKPWDNAAMGLEWGVNQLLRPVSAASQALGGPAINTQGIDQAVGSQSAAQSADAHKAFIDQKAQEGVKPGGWGNIAGEIAGTLPTLYLPGGVLAQGAMGGALTTDARDPAGIAASAATGTLTGKATEFGLNGITNTIAPRIGKAAQQMLDIGAPLTTGMINGGKGVLGRLESITGSIIPGAAELVRMRGNEALKGLNTGVADLVAKPYGAPKLTGENGQEVYQGVKQAVENTYSSVSKGADVTLDHPFATDMASINADVSHLPDDLRTRFGRVMAREVRGRLDPQTGSMTAEGVADAKAAINKEIAKWKGTNGFESDYVEQLKAARSAITRMLGRTSPEAEATLAAADRGYPDFKTYERAVKNSTQNQTTADGFTPQHLQSALNTGATSGKIASGVGDLPQLATAAKEVLPRRFKDVVSPMSSFIEGGVGLGVIGTDILGGHGAGMKMAAPAVAMSLFYSRPVQDALRAGLLKTAAGRKALEAYIGVPLETVIGKGSGLLAAPATPLVQRGLLQNASPAQ